MSEKSATEKTEGTQAKAPNVCFGCGEANPGGMHLPFTRDEANRRVTGRFRLEERYQGAPGMAHGGIIAVVLDEALGKVSRFYNARAVTATLDIEYLRPVLIGEEIFVEAHMERAEGRNLFHVGEIRDGEGRLLARAKGRFVVVDPEAFRRKNGVNIG